MAISGRPQPKKKTKIVGGSKQDLPKNATVEAAVEQSIKEELSTFEGAALSNISSADNRVNWTNSRQTVETFNPVPWYIWRLVNFAIGGAGEIRSYDHGMVFALKRLLLRAAQDPEVTGMTEECRNTREAVSRLAPDVFAAISIVHSIAKKIRGKKFDRISKPILEEAILRTRIGFSLGSKLKSFGRGRGMLAGFAGRAGLAVQIAQGTFEQATETLERIAAGQSIQRIGREVYQAEPLQVSAMLLVASGCGRDAAYGVMAVAAPDLVGQMGLNEEQERWRTALRVMEEIRAGNLNGIPEVDWKLLGCETTEETMSLRSEIRQVTRRGHNWSWLGE